MRKLFVVMIRMRRRVTMIKRMITMVMMGVTIRQGPVVHVVETAVVLGAGGWTEVEVRPGQVDDDHDDALDDDVHILMLL